jgi:tetratricopeptide (TPR) repeat protein
LADFDQLFLQPWSRGFSRLLAALACTSVLSIGSAAHAAEVVGIDSKVSKPPSVSAQRNLAEGIALFEDGQYARAHSQLKKAVATGLADGRDAALAHKYLAFYYCLHGVRRQCVKSFERALRADSDQDLNPEERNNSEWLAAFNAARQNVEKSRINNNSTGVRISTDSESRAKLKPKKDVAVLIFDVMPWGAMYINGKLRAVSPPDKQLWLPSGNHRIKIVNGKDNAVDAQYRLAGGEVYILEYKFE